VCVCVCVCLSGDAFLHCCTYFCMTLGNSWGYPLVINAPGNNLCIGCVTVATGNIGTFEHEMLANACACCIADCRMLPWFWAARCGIRPMKYQEEEYYMSVLQLPPLYVVYSYRF